MKIAIGGDEVGSPFLDALLQATDILRGHEVVDVRADVVEIGYAPMGAAVGERVRDGLVDRGLLVCGTGIGVCIAANKVHGVRAAVCHDLYSTQRSVLSNDCQIACFGARVIAVDAAAQLLQVWLSLTFDHQTRSAAKVGELREEEEHERSAG